MRTLLIFALIFSFFGCKNTERNSSGKLSTEKSDSLCVENIFKQDSILGEIRNHASEELSLSQAITNYTKSLESLDFSGCPENFTTSFKNHIDAWRKVLKVSDKYPLLRGELHDLFSELEKSNDSTEFKSVVKGIWDTWNIVEENSQ